MLMCWRASSIKFDVRVKWAIPSWEGGDDADDGCPTGGGVGGHQSRCLTGAQINTHSSTGTTYTSCYLMWISTQLSSSVAQLHPSASSRLHFVPMAATSSSRWVAPQWVNSFYAKFPLVTLEQEDVLDWRQVENDSDSKAAYCLWVCLAREVICSLPDQPSAPRKPAALPRVGIWISCGPPRPTTLPSPRSADPEPCVVECRCGPFRQAPNSASSP